MFGQCPIFVYLGLRSIRMLCEQAQIGEDGVLAEYLLLIILDDQVFFILTYMMKGSAKKT